MEILKPFGGLRVLDASGCENFNENIKQVYRLKYRCRPRVMGETSETLQK